MSGPTRRLRMFAGPNGSGKSTIIGRLDPRLTTTLVTADDLERELNGAGVDLAAFGLAPTRDEVAAHFEASAWLLDHVPAFTEADLALAGTTLHVRGATSYHAAVLADLLRRQLLRAGRSFAFETVMSSRDKVEFLREARAAGYRTYLYFVSTVDPEINVSRVAARVRLGGHDVPTDRVRSRYARSHALLLDAVRHTDRAFIFDNSDDPEAQGRPAAHPEDLLVAEVTNGELVELKTDAMPFWFYEAVWQRLPPESEVAP